jgi:hypothetical protein
MKFWIYAVYFHLYLQETKANVGLKMILLNCIISQEQRQIVVQVAKDSISDTYSLFHYCIKLRKVLSWQLHG